MSELAPLLLHLGILTLAALAIVSLLATFGEGFREVLLQALALLVRPLTFVERIVDAAREGLTGWLQAQLAFEGDGNAARFPYFVIGAVVYTAFTGLFGTCDTGLVVLGLEAFGFHTSSGPADAGLIAAIALAAGPVAWGVLFLDSVGTTHLAPWMDNWGGKSRLIFSGASGLFCVLSIAVLAAMAWWRCDCVVSDITAEAEAAPDEPALPLASNGGLTIGPDAAEEPVAYDLEADTAVPAPSPWIPYVVLVGSTVTTVFATIFCACGVWSLAKYLIMGATFLFVVFLRLAGWIVGFLVSVLEGILSVLQSALNLLISLGERFLGLFRSTSSDHRVPRLEGQAPEGSNPSDPATPEDSLVHENDPADASKDFVPRRQAHTGFDPFGAEGSKI